MQSNKIQYKYLIFISMLYITIKLSTIVLIYKIIKIGPFSASASTLVLPLWFVMGDIIAEVYGYKVARHVIWMAILCQCIFASVCTLFVSLPLLSCWPDQKAYNQILGRLPRIVFASSIAIISSTFINAYIISKWKILLRGKYFWLRSIGASTIGELVFTLITFTQFIGVISFTQLLYLMTISYMIQLFMNPILATPSMLISTLLKQAEGVDAYDDSINFNPFKTNSEKKRDVDSNISIHEHTH